MKPYIVSLLLACLGIFDTQQANGEDNQFLSGSFTSVLNTAYMGKIGAVFYRGPTSVNYLDVNIGSNWTAEIWSSTHLGSEPYNTTFGDEFDLFLTWHHQFNDVRISLTGGYFFIKDLGVLHDDLWIGEAEMSYTKWTYFQPYICARYFGQVTSKSPDNGWFGWVGVRGCYSTPLKQVKLSVDLSAAYSDGALGATPGLVFGRAVIGLPIQLSKRVTLTPSVLLQTPIGTERNHQFRYTDRNEAVGSLALSVSF